MFLLRHAIQSAAWLFALFILVTGTAMLAPTSASSPLEAADRAWKEGRATEAYHLYLAFERTGPLPAASRLRLAALALERGACGQAELLAAQVLLDTPKSEDAALAHLIRARCVLDRADGERAAAEIDAIDPRLPHHALAFVLSGEAALQRGDSTAARDHLAAALHKTLPQPWAAFAHLRMAQAGDDRAAALDHLAAIPSDLLSPDPATRSLLPLRPTAIIDQAARLSAVLAAPASDQPQLRGQYFLDTGLYALALRHFEQLAHHVIDDPRPHAYAAYARAQLGQRDAALATLHDLAARFPNTPIVATLYATLLLEAGDSMSASEIIDRAETHALLDPAFALVRSDVLAAQGRYADAVAERRRARDLASPEQRPTFALALAQQHLDLAYNLCADGVTAAQQATQLAPDESRVWQALAASYFHCHRYTDAIDAARRGVEHAPEDAALHFYLGAALWEQGDQAEGRLRLLQAADLAPNGEWRMRAERVLQIEQQPLAENVS